MPIALTTISINVAVIQTMGSIVIALAVMWVVRKLIKIITGFNMKSKIISIILCLIALLIININAFADEIDYGNINCGIRNGGDYIYGGVRHVVHFYPTMAEAGIAYSEMYNSVLYCTGGIGDGVLVYDPAIWSSYGLGCTVNEPEYYWQYNYWAWPEVADCGGGVPLYNVDTDGDGVPASDDKCPTIPGSQVNGCPKMIELGEGGDCPKDNFVANPINIFNGNNFEKETDLAFNTPFKQGVAFKRSYNSQSTNDSTIGYGWTHNYHVVLYPNFGNNSQLISIVGSTGRGYYFEDSDEDGIFEGAILENSSVSKDLDGDYIWTKNDGTIYMFDQTSGQLLSITDKSGNIQTFLYNTNNLLETVTDQATGRTLTFHYNTNNKIDHISGPVTTAVPDGVWVTYTYDSNNNLTKVQYADDGNGSLASGFEYVYEDTNDPNNMTGKKDLEGHVLSTWAYNGNDQAIESVNNQGTSATINFDNPNEIAVTDAYGMTSIYHIKNIKGRQKITEKTRPSECISCSSDIYKTEFDDTTGATTRREYYNGRVDLYSDYDNNLNPQTNIIAQGTSDEITIYKTYHPSLSTPLTITQKSLFSDTANPNRDKEIIYDYDNDYNTIPNENPTPLLSRIIEKGFTVDNSGSVIPYEHITTYHYNSKGQSVSIDGPLSGNQDTVTMTYDPATGNLLTVSQPLIGTKTYANYDAAGNPGSITDENQIITNFTYDGRNRISSKEVNGVTTSLNYTLAGNIDSITDGAGRSFTYAYHSTSGLLERVTDPLENLLRYTYDDKGNRIEDSSYDTQNVRQRHMRFDYHSPQTPGRLWKIINPDNSEKVYSYDEMGNVSNVVDELNKATNYSYDLLNRLTTVTQPGSVVTGYDYDSQNNLASVLLKKKP